MRKQLLFLFLCSLFGTMVFGSTIQGKIVDRKGIGKGGIKVLVRSDLGLKFESISRENGGYQFRDLPEGWYFIRLENLENYRVISPECGWYYEFITQEEGVADLDFTIESSGVSIDFGRPGGGGGGGGGGGTLQSNLNGSSLNSNSFSLSVYANGLTSFGFSYPTSLEIHGFWYSLGSGPLEIDVLSGMPAGAYPGSGLEVSYNVSATNLVSLYLDLEKFPFLTLNGEIATFKFLPSVSALNILNLNEANACFCITSMRIWSGASLIYSTSDQWCDQLLFD